MLAILNFLNAHNLPILQPILMILVSKFMVHRALSDKTYLSLGLLSPLNLSKGQLIEISNLSRVIWSPVEQVGHGISTPRIPLSYLEVCVFSVPCYKRVKQVDNHQVEQEKVIEETDEDGGWVDTHHFSGSMLNPKF